MTAGSQRPVCTQVCLTGVLGTALVLGGVLLVALRNAPKATPSPDVAQPGSCSSQAQSLHSAGSLCPVCSSHNPSQHGNCPSMRAQSLKDGIGMVTAFSSSGGQADVESAPLLPDGSTSCAVICSVYSTGDVSAADACPTHSTPYTTLSSSFTTAAELSCKALSSDDLPHNTATTTQHNPVVFTNRCLAEHHPAGGWASQLCSSHAAAPILQRLLHSHCADPTCPACHPAHHCLTSSSLTYKPPPATDPAVHNHPSQINNNQDLTYQMPSFRAWGCAAASQSVPSLSSSSPPSDLQPHPPATHHSSSFSAWASTPFGACPSAPDCTQLGSSSHAAGHQVPAPPPPSCKVSPSAPSAAATSAGGGAAPLVRCCSYCGAGGLVQLASAVGAVRARASDSLRRAPSMPLQLLLTPVQPCQATHEVFC